MNFIKNACYHDKYIIQRQKDKVLFTAENFSEVITTELGCGYIIIKSTYEGVLNGCNREVSQNIILKDSKTIFTYLCLDTSGEFCKVFTDEYNKDYFVFREDLYGYSVYSVSEQKHFTYYPLSVLEGKEDFIWTNFDYDKKSKLAVIDGCFWGYPYSFLIADFTNPMLTCKSFDIQNFIDNEYEKYCDFNSYKFTEDGIEFIGESEDISKINKLFISFEECKKHLKKIDGV